MSARALPALAAALARVLPALAAALACALPLLAAPAWADRRSDLAALREAIELSRERVADYEQRERGLLDVVEALDRAASLLSSDVARARREVDEAQAELREIEAEAAEIAARLAVTRRAMKARARALYRTGELGAVRILFSADGLPEFLSRVSALRRLLDHDAELLDRRRRQVAELAEAEVRVRATGERSAAAEVELRSRSEELERERAQKRRIVARLHADRARERAALVELEKAAQALEETLASLGAEPLPGGATAGPPFLTLRRRLQPPVDASVVRRFGREVDPRDGTETFHSGVLFEVPRGTPVRAVAAGQVRFAGWFRGYGRMAILDHGGGYFSVSGHLDALSVEVGDPVGRGEAIGSSGDTGSLAGPRLYFEIRRGAEALDPADWLRPRAAG